MHICLMERLYIFVLVHFKKKQKINLQTSSWWGLNILKNSIATPAGKYLKEYFLNSCLSWREVWRSSKEKNEIGPVIQRDNTALTQTAALATCTESLWPRTSFNFCTSDWKQKFSYVATKSIWNRAYNIQTRRGKNMEWKKSIPKKTKNWNKQTYTKQDN